MELLRSIAAKTSAKIYLVHFFGPKNDPVLAKLPGNVELVAATPEDFPYVMRDDVMGFDDHGRPYWHDSIYSRLPQAIPPSRPPACARPPRTTRPRHSPVNPPSRP